MDSETLGNGDDRMPALEKLRLEDDNADGGIDAQDAAAHYVRGRELQALGRLEEAIDDYDKALALGMYDADIWFYRANAQFNLGHLVTALESYGRALSLKPDFVDAYCNRGIAFNLQCRFQEGLIDADHAIAAKPEAAVAFSIRGSALKGLGRLEEALDAYDRAISLNSAYSEAFSNKASVLNEMHRHEEARTNSEMAISLRPNNAIAHYNLGNALFGLGRYEDATLSYTRAVELRPNYWDAYSNRGVALRNSGRYAEAVDSYERTLRAKPDHANINWNMSQLRLLLGDYIEGWRQYESRLVVLRTPTRTFKHPRWTGEEPLDGRTLLVCSEQGLGDVIQFSRYIPLLEARGARIVLQSYSPLVRLLSTLPGQAAIVEQGADLPDFDCWCPMMSLPLALSTRLDTIPADIPYLFADPVRSARWRERLGPQKGLRVGLVWSGGLRPGRPELAGVNRRRNIPLGELAPLNIPGIDFYSLQKGKDAVAQLRGLRTAGWAGPAIVDHSDEFADFADTAAFVDNLDLVIAVDTSIAHLAGAMGKEVWLLNRFDTCWRWLLDRSDSPWYPTLTIFRQPAAGEWEAVVAAAVGRLRERAAADVAVDDLSESGMRRRG